MFAAWAYKSTDWNGRRAAIAAVCVIAIMLGIGFWMKGVDFLSSDGRTYMWKLALCHWNDAKILTQLFGFGNGSMQTLFPQWQSIEYSMHAIPGHGANNYDYFFWIHSDWLQVLIEQGILGLVSWIILFICVCQKASKISGRLFASVIGFGATALFNFPVHLTAHAVVGAAIAAMAFKEKETQWVQ